MRITVPTVELIGIEEERVMGTIENADMTIGIVSPLIDIDQSAPFVVLETNRALNQDQSSRRIR